MTHLTRLCISFAFAFLSFGQNFCPAGGTANGFVDWTKLPPAASGAGAFSQTIPVSGLSGLTLTLSAPASPNNAAESTYLVLDGTRLLVRGGQRQVTFTFNKSIRGLRMMAEMTVFGGFEQSLSLKGIGGIGTVAHPNFSTSTSQHNDSPNHVTLTPLQITADSDAINQAVLSFEGDADYNNFIIGNVRVESGPEIPDPASIVPVKQLRQWFRADKGLTFGNHANDSVAGWEDQSPGGANAIQDDPAKYPFVVHQNGEYCQPAVRFGSGSFFKASLPISGWQQMTIFLLARSYNDDSDGSYHSFHPAIFWSESGTWGMTYLSAFQTHLAFRFGTGQPFNYPEVQRDGNIGGDLTLTTAVHNGSVDSLYVNGKLMANVTGRMSALANVSSDEFIGLGSQNTSFTGDISEILIYDRVLTEAERKTVESYLAKKYGRF